MSYQQKLISLLAQSNLQKRKHSLKQQRNYMINDKDRIISDQLLRSGKNINATIDYEFKPQNQPDLSAIKPNERQCKTMEVKKIFAAKNLYRRDREDEFMQISMKARQGKALSKYERQLRYKTQSSINEKSTQSKNQTSLEKAQNQSDRKRILNRLQRINQYTLLRLRNRSLTQKQQIRYKNEKISILAHTNFNKKRKQSQDLSQNTKFQADLQLLIQHFDTNHISTSEIQRQLNQSYQSLRGRLLFFIGYEILMRYSDKFEGEFQTYEIVISNYYQIYYSMKLGFHVLVLQCYLVLMDFAIEQNNYAHAQKYAQKCLLASIYYKQKYYEQKSIQKISMCQYYRGNICEATYLHDNNGQVTQDSVRKIRDGYNQTQELQIIFHHLYETVRFDVRELLADYEHDMKGYKAMVVFQSPRIGLDDSMVNKKNQLKIDIISMERMRLFKQGVDIMKKEVKRHESLFSVRKAQNETNSFKLVKRNLAIDQQNQSSQVLRAHQSMNRVNVVNKRSIMNRLLKEFVQFCVETLNRIR